MVLNEQTIKTSAEPKFVNKNVYNYANLWKEFIIYLK